MILLNFHVSFIILCLSLNFIFGFSEDFDVDKNSDVYFKKEDLLPVEEGLDYVDDDKHVGKANQSCRTIDGPGAGKPCVFPWTFMGNVYNTCILGKKYWCATAVDENGRYVWGRYAYCSLGCPGVKYEGYKETKCATEDAGVQCSLPFSYAGYTYNGCIKTIRTRGDKHWCVVKDEMAEHGFRRVNCSDSCPKARALSEEILSPEVIIEKLKTNPWVPSMIERGRDCIDYMASYNMTKVGQRPENILQFFI